jgi:LysM repeat protein
MNDNPDKEMDELMQGIADELDYANEDESIKHSRKQDDSKPQRRTIVLWGGVILLLIVLVALLFGGNDEVATEKPNAIDARVDQIEERLRALEGIDARIAKLEEREKALTQSIARANSSGQTLAGRVDKLNREVNGLQKRSASLAAKTGTPPAVQPEAVSGSEGRYHVVRAGDSLYRIAQKYGMSVGDLRRLNNISAKQAIYPGQKILVAEGRSR